MVDEGGTDVWRQTAFYHWAPSLLGSMASELLRKVCARMYVRVSGYVLVDARITPLSSLYIGNNPLAY